MQIMYAFKTYKAKMGRTKSRKRYAIVFGDFNPLLSVTNRETDQKREDPENVIIELDLTGHA